ncbi:MAG: hypothetical protein MUE68_05850 [Bacteroidetes bacterium]|jgi:Tol biopolymer transport system component|nr:hypothetical protein [Bacteroidota bacterium]
MQCAPIIPAILLAALACIGCENSSSLDEAGLSAYRHLRPFWSPAGDRIGFTDTNVDHLGIWSVDSTGRSSTLIHAGDVSGGSWSADGQWVAFARSGQIVARKVGGDSLRVLVTTPGSLRPSWSTDGRTIAFIRGGVRAYDVGSGIESWVSSTGSYAHWIRNTRSVLVTIVNVQSGHYAYELQRVHVDSAYAQDLATFRTSDDCAFFVPSQDGQTVYFGRKPSDGRSEVWSLSLTTFQSRRLTTDGGDYPAVSPDGEWIVYTRTASDDGGLWLMRKDGSEKRRLTDPVR